MARSRGAHGVTRRTKKQAIPEGSSKKEIWSSMLEGRYTVTVHWLRPYRGKLTIWEGEKLIHSQKLALMYHAFLGRMSMTSPHGRKSRPRLWTV